MKLEYAIIYGLWALISTAVFQLIIQKYSFIEIIGQGGIVYFSVLPFVIYYSVINRKNIINSIAQNIELSAQKAELQELNKNLMVRIKERELLIKEIHHRVKNNLQIISSLLSLQKEANSNNNVKDILQISQNRIDSMLIIHEKLYQKNNFDNIYIQEYFEDLINSLNNTINTKNHKVFINIENITLEINKLIACGLIINELFTNSIQHAFPNNREGEISITGKKENSTYLLKISDNGVGFNSENIKHNSLGLKLVKGLSKQIDGEFITLKSVIGSSFVIKFNITSYH